MVDDNGHTSEPYRRWFDLIKKTLSGLPAFASAPAKSASPGTVGQMATDGTYFYICVATNVWKRVLLTVF